MSEFSTEIAKPFEFNNPGPLDKNRGPYPTLAAACDAIPNEWKNVGGINRNLREGKIVDIGIEPYTEEYRWKGGFENHQLVRNIDPVDFESKFPFQPHSDKGWYDVFKDFIVDVYFNFGKNPNLLYSFAIIQKNDNSIGLFLYSQPADGGDFTRIGVFSTAPGYDPTSMEPLLLTHESLGQVVVIPGAIGTTDQTGLSYGLLGLDDAVFDKIDRRHVYISNINFSREVSIVAESLSELNSEINPKFPFQINADNFWYTNFKNFIIDVKLTFDPDPDRYYSFAIIQKNDTSVGVFLYSTSDQGASDVRQESIFSSNINLGYSPTSMDPFLIENGSGSIVIVPGAIGTTNQGSLFYSFLGLDKTVFEPNNRKNVFILAQSEQHSGVVQPEVDFSYILNAMFFRWFVKMEFCGDSITFGQDGEGVTFPQIMFKAVIEAYNDFSPVNTPGSSLNFSIVNKGAGGTTTSDGIVKINENTGGANVCFIMYMYNDCRYNLPQYVPPAQYKANLDYMVRTAISQGKLAILGIEPNISTSFQTGLLPAHRAAVLEIARKYGVYVWDFTEQIWDIQFQPDGLHMDKYTYYGMGWDMAGMFTTMNYFNNIKPCKGDEIFVTHNVQNVASDWVQNNQSAVGKAFSVPPGKTLAFAFEIQENASFYVKTLNSNDGTVSAPFKVNYYASLKNPLPQITPSGGKQKFTIMDIKRGKRLITIRNTSTTGTLIIESIGFE